MAGSKTHKDLLVWQKAIDFVEKIYNLKDFFKSEERYGLYHQIKKCAISIPSNIAEGAARNHKKEFLQFLYISMGSISEIETQLIIAERVKLIEKRIFDELNSDLTDIRKLLSGLIRKLKSET